MKLRWLDFGAYDVGLKLIKAPTGAHYLVLSGVGMPEVDRAATTLGFRFHKNNRTVMVKLVHLREDGTIDIVSPGDFQKALPKTKVVEFSESLHFENREGFNSNQPTAKAAAPAATDEPLKGETIGWNKLSLEVFDAGGVRWIRDKRGNIIHEAETDPPNPGLYLRAVDDASLASCADALVEQAGSGKIIRLDEFNHFLSVIYPGQEVTEARRLQVRMAVEGSMARWQARTTAARTMQEAFIAGGKIRENAVFMVDGRSPATLAPLGPMNVVAQRLLGTEAALKGKTIVVSSPFAGALVSKLPASAAVEAYSTAQQQVADTASVFVAAGNKTGKSSTGRADFAVADAMIFDQPAKRVAVLAEVNGKAFARADYAEVLRALGNRKDRGTAVFLLDIPTDEAEVEELLTLRDEIAQHYSFEGEALVDSSLWRGILGGPGKSILSVGPRLPESNPDNLPPVVREVHDWTTLWTWGAEVIVGRARAEAKLTQAEVQDVAVQLNAADGTQRNAYQTPYVSASSIGTPSTMVPRNLEGPSREALERIVRIYGDIDVFVAEEFGYTKQELGEIFSPEQVDALALYVHAERRDRGFLLADQTGVGKGRTLAAVMRRAALRGETSFFVTEREPNLSDIWRDIVATRSDKLFTPLVVNADAKIIDRTTKQVVMRGADKSVMDGIIKSGTLPAEFNLFLGTYSQFNRDISLASPAVRDPAAKSRWFAKALGKNVRLILDESHNASGDSNVSDNVTEAVESAGGVCYSSATFAASSERLAFYRKLFPDDLSTTELSAMMSRGGETFQEVLSAMLVHDGVMIRREFDLSKVTFETVMDTARFERNKGYMDAVAPVLSEMAALSSDIDRRIAAMNRRRREGDDQPAGAGRPAFQVTRMGFGSPLYTITRLFVAALKVDVVVDDAIAHLRNNEKPIILVENTMQQLLEELAEMDDVEDVAVDFRALFNRTLRRMVTSTWKDEAGGSHKRDISASDAVLREKFEKIRSMIELLPDIPVSVIDEVKSRIAAAGYTIDEITGRSLEVRGGKIMRRSVTSATVVKNDFNDGVLDALVINNSGTTGIDLHASATFPDKRRRIMMELQPPADILRKMQAHGRVNRFDQVVDPKVKSFVSGLPIEMRLNAMENAKLRRLSANTTSNRDAAQLTRDIPDLINPIGDVVCSRYAEARPDLMRRLGFRVGDVEQNAESNLSTEAEAAESLRKGLKVGGKPKEEREDVFRVADTKRSANEILARLIMLPVDVQTRVCNELSAEFHAAVEELEARGETPLRTNDLAGIIHPRDKTVFDGADIEDPDSVFHEPLYVVNAALERTGKAMRSDDVAQRIELGEMASGRAVPCIDRLRRGQDEILEAYLPDGIATVAEAIARGNAEITRRKDRLDRLALILEDIRPGREVSYTVDEEVITGIVTRVEYPNRGYEHVPGLYGVEFVIPGDEKPRTMRLETLMRDPNFRLADGLEGADYEGIMRRYDDAVLTKLSTVRLLTHNIFRAMRLNVEHRLGSLVTFKMADGTVHRGIVVSKRHQNLKAIPVEIESFEMAYEAVLAENVELNGSSSLTDKTFLIKPSADGNVELKLPTKGSKKHGYIYDNAKLSELLRRSADKGKGGHVQIIPRSEFREVIQALYSVGAKFWAPPLNREWSFKYLAARHGAALEREGRQEFAR